MIQLWHPYFRDADDKEAQRLRDCLLAHLQPCYSQSMLTVETTGVADVLITVYAIPQHDSKLVIAQ